MMNRSKSSRFQFSYKLFIAVVAAMVIVGVFSFKDFTAFSEVLPDQARGNDPAGWFLAGSNPSSYEIGTSEMNGNTVAYLKSLEEQVQGFGTIMQTASADEFKGKRVRLTAKIKTEAVSDWCGLWFRVDGAAREALAFDNMQSRPIQGTTDWKQYEVVLDVSPESKAIAYGVLLSNTGSVWIDDVSFEVVDKTVSVTSASVQSAPNKPANLDFEN